MRSGGALRKLFEILPVLKGGGILGFAARGSCFNEGLPKGGLMIAVKFPTWGALRF